MGRHSGNTPNVDSSVGSPEGSEMFMDHDTKPTHYEPPGFEPTPRNPEAGCLSAMVLRRCGELCPSHPHEIQRWQMWDV